MYIENMKLYIEETYQTYPTAYLVLPIPNALPKSFYAILHYTKTLHPENGMKLQKNMFVEWGGVLFFYVHTFPLYLKSFFAIVTGRIFAITTDLVFFASMSIRHCDAY